jgi:hypothetical protein
VSDLREAEPANADDAGIPGQDAPKYLFVDGPLHGLLLPVADTSKSVLHTESATTYVFMKYTQNEAHPITGQPVPTWERYVWVSQALSGQPVPNQMNALMNAVMTAWFRTGERVQDAGAVTAIVDAPTPEHTMTCTPYGAACWSFTHASLAKAAKAAADHNADTGHPITHTTSTPEPPMPGDGEVARTEETPK